MIIKRVRIKLAKLLVSQYNLEVVQRSRFNETLNNLLKNPNFFFIQVGAHDGVRFDDLYQKVTHQNTHGIVIEPLKKYFRRLVMNYEDYPNIIPLNIALHPIAHEVDIHHVDFDKTSLHEPWSGGIGSVLPNHHEKTNIQKEFMTTSKVKAKSFMDIVNEYDVKNIDLLQIDVEGFDFEILKMIDFNKIKPKLIKYEYVNMDKNTQQESVNLLKKHGYDVHIENEDAIGILR